MYLIRFIGPDREILEYLVEDINIQEGRVCCNNFCERDSSDATMVIKPVSSFMTLPLCKVVAISQMEELEFSPCVQ